MDNEKTPTWKNGEPDNLSAAAMDALEWLYLMRVFMQREKPPGSSLSVAVWQDAQRRLDCAIESLEIYMPEDYTVWPASSKGG